ncbi:MAG: hypothetical protein HOY69_27550, partial [Streptomyces sp.]|nr:hypothetical protein [Streptomyces sp.]
MTAGRGGTGAAGAAGVLGIDVGGTKVALRAEDGDRAEESLLRWPGPGPVAADWAALA